MHLIIVSTVCFSPASRNTWDPPIDAAYSEVVTSVSGVIVPSASASKINSSVITFVTLAGGFFSSAFFSKRICPPEASIITADSADSSRPVRLPELSPFVCSGSSCLITSCIAFGLSPGSKTSAARTGIPYTVCTHRTMPSRPARNLRIIRLLFSIHRYYINKPSDRKIEPFFTLPGSFFRLPH